MVLRKSLFIAASFLSLFSVTILADNNNNPDTIAPTKQPYLELYGLNTQMSFLFTQQSPVTDSTSTIRDAIKQPQSPTLTGSMFGEWQDNFKKENKTQPDYSFLNLLNSTFNNTNPYKIYAGFTAWFKKNLFW